MKYFSFLKIFRIKNSKDHLIPIRMATTKINKQEIMSVGKDVENLELSYTPGGNTE